MSQTTEETLSCFIEWTRESSLDVYRVSFETYHNGSQEMKFSTLEEALDFVRDTFPTVLDKWKLARGLA